MITSNQLIYLIALIVSFWTPSNSYSFDFCPFINQISSSISWMDPILRPIPATFFFFQYFSISDMNECQWQWISGNLPREFSQFWIHPWKDKNWMRTLFFAVSHRRVQHVTEPRQAGLTNHQCRLHRLAGVSIYNNKSKIKSWKRKSKLKLSTAQYNNTTL